MRSVSRTDLFVLSLFVTMSVISTLYRPLSNRSRKSIISVDLWRTMSQFQLVICYSFLAVCRAHSPSLFLDVKSFFFQSTRLFPSLREISNIVLIEIQRNVLRETLHILQALRRLVEGGELEDVETFLIFLLNNLIKKTVRLCKIK